MAAETKVTDTESLEIMEIRKLTESDYNLVIELYKELDEFHVQVRPEDAESDLRII